MINYKPDQSQIGPSIENMIFIDFQYSCCTSPAIDLHFFLNTSLQESLRPRRFDELIAYYHGNLETNLKRLGYRKLIPNLEQFKQQYHDKSFYGKNVMKSYIFSSVHETLKFRHFQSGFIVSCIVQPILINESTEKGNCETFISDDEHALEFKRAMFAAPKIQANLQKLIPIYDEMGTFEVK